MENEDNLFDMCLPRTTVCASNRLHAYESCLVDFSFQTFGDLVLITYSDFHILFCDEMKLLLVKFSPNGVSWP